MERRKSPQNFHLFSPEDYKICLTEPNERARTGFLDLPDPDMESIARPRKEHHLIFTHFNHYRRLWEYIIFIVAGSPVFEISFLAIFCPHLEFSHYVPFLIFDLLFIIDIFVVLRTSYLSNGVLVTNPKRIRRRYEKLSLIIQIIAAIPISWIGIIIGESWVIIVFSLTRILRIKRAVLASYTISKSLIYGAWSSTLVQLVFILFMIIHFFACIFYITAYFEGTYESWIGILKWDYLLPPQQYVVSIYFVMTTIFTIGNGDISGQTSAERIVVIFIQLIGVMMNAYIVSTMVSLLLDPIGQQFVQSFGGMISYMQFKGLPHELQMEVIHYYQTKWEQFHGTDDPVNLYAFVPETIREKIKQDFTHKFTSQVGIFQICSNKLRLRLSHLLRTVSYIPGETIIIAEQIHPTLYLLKSGGIQIYINNMLFSTQNCETGVVFGEKELFVDLPANMTVKAVTYVEGWTISREDLVQSLKHQQDLLQEFLDMAKVLYPKEYKDIRRLLFQSAMPMSRSNSFNMSSMKIDKSQTKEKSPLNVPG